MNEYTIKAKSFEILSSEGTLVVTIDEPTDGAVTIKDRRHSNNTIELMFTELIACANLVSQVMVERLEKEADSNEKKPSKKKVVDMSNVSGSNKKS